MIRKLLSILLFSCFIESNEVVFHEVNEVGNDTVEISFFLNSVSFIKSYSLENPSRIVMDLYDTLIRKGYVDPPGRPRKGQKAVKPMIATIIGQSLRTVRRKLNQAQKMKEATPQDLLHQNVKKMVKKMVF